MEKYAHNATYGMRKNAHIYLSAAALRTNVLTT